MKDKIKKALEFRKITPTDDLINGLEEILSHNFDLEDLLKIKHSCGISNGGKYHTLEVVIEHEGDFDFIDTHVNQSTDTLLVRAVFPNPEQVLVPGQYVNVTVRQKEATLRMVVPQAAMQKDQTGYYVLVVNQNNRVEIRRVQAGEQVNQVWVVLDGLAEGERVIVQGVQKVKANSEVKAVPYQ